MQFRDVRGRLTAALTLAAAVALLAACNTVGGTVSGMGQDIGATGRALTGNPPNPPPPGTPAPANQIQAPANQAQAPGTAATPKY